MTGSPPLQTGSRHLTNEQSRFGLQIGQHSPVGVTSLPSSHVGTAQSTAEQSGGAIGRQMGQHSPSGVKSSWFGLQTGSAQSTLLQSMGRSLHTGQHSPSGVNLSSSLQSGSRQRIRGQNQGRGCVGNLGIHRGQHSPGRVTLMPSTHATAVQKTLRQSTGRRGTVL